VEEKPDKLTVEIVPHSGRWATMAAAETLRLKAALGDVLVAVHHVGSTAIADIKAKPIVVLLPVVRDLAGLDAKEGAIRALGYRWFGEFGLPGRRYCYAVDPVTGKRTFQLHWYAQDNTQIARHLAFRDYLIAHPTLAKEYEAEKLRAASVRSDDVNAYNAEKNDWIKRVEKDALAWWAMKQHALERCVARVPVPAQDVLVTTTSANAMARA
jgi:GrpB-like predicted nucleotidyltransferase (UPF0157 family)